MPYLLSLDERCHTLIGLVPMALSLVVTVKQIKIPQIIERAMKMIKEPRHCNA